VAAGFALGRAVHPSHTPRLAVAQAGPLSLTFARDHWKTAVPPRVPGLRLEGPIALKSTVADQPGTVLAGIAPNAEGAGLLPPAPRAQLTGRAPAAPGSLRAGGARPHPRRAA